MEIAFLSDLHIQKPNDSADLLFERFTTHQSVISSSHIFLLGDMFDVLVGEHKGYIDKYQRFFSNLLTFLDDGKIVYYLEGNHDFHIQKTLEQYVARNSKNASNFYYRRKGEKITLGNKVFHYCHGYEVDYNNEYFKKWYNIYSSKKFNFLVSRILSFSLIDYFGQRAAGNSKKRGGKVFDRKAAKVKYIAGAKEFIDENKIAGVICGHTHIQESYLYPDGTIYYNCGFPRSDKNFLHYSDREGFRFLSLEES